MTHLDYVNVTVRTLDSWDLYFVHGVIYRIFISWKSSPSTFLKINFDGTIIGGIGGVDFIIQDPNLRLVAMRSSSRFELSILEVELRDTRASIVHARFNLQTNWLVIEVDSSTIID